MKTYIQPTINNQDAIQIIKTKIHDNSPFLLTRYGDGEITVLNRTVNDKLLKKYCEINKYQFPDEIDKFYQDFQSILINSIKSSDMIGFLNKTTSQLPVNFYKESLWSLPLDFFKQNQIDLKSKFIVDHMITRSFELGNINSFKEILNGKSLHIISPNKSKLESKKLSNLLEASVNITESPFGIKIHNRSEFIQSLAKIKESVVIYGCSLHKDYGAILKNQYGKTVLDFGATLDAWTGIESRPWFQQGQCQEYLMIK